MLDDLIRHGTCYDPSEDDDEPEPDPQAVPSMTGD